MGVRNSKAAWEAQGWRREVGSDPTKFLMNIVLSEVRDPRGAGASATRCGFCRLPPTPTPWPPCCVSCSRFLPVGSRRRLLLPATRTFPSCPVTGDGATRAVSGRKPLGSGVVSEERRRGVGVGGALGVSSIHSTDGQEALPAKAGAGHRLPTGPALSPCALSTHRAQLCFPEPSFTVWSRHWTAFALCQAAVSLA